MTAHQPTTDRLETGLPLVEVLDRQRRPVAVVPATDAERQKLPHRSVAVLLYEEDEGRLILRRLGGRWDIFLRGPVLAGEAVTDAARRILSESAGLHVERLRPHEEIPAQPENGNQFLHVFSHVLRTEALPLLNAERPDPGAPGNPAKTVRPDDYAFTPEELECLLRDFRELVSPRLLFLAERLGVRRGRRP